LIALAYIAFISLGMPDGLFGVAWPSIREDFSLRLDSVGAFFFAGTTGYMLSSFFSGKIIKRLGVGGTLAASCALTASALLGYTLVPTWWMMVSLAVASGLGAGAIDAGLNTYVASHFGEGLMQWLHASYGFGVTLGPIIMTTGLNVFNSWRLGYQVVGATQLLLAASFLVTIRMWQNGGVPHAPEQERHLMDYHTPFGETLRQPVVLLNLLMFFLYTGAEFSFGSWTYSLLTLSRDVPVEVAGLWAGSYWATFTIGRVMAGLLTRRFGMANLLKVGFLAALGGSLLLWWNPFPQASIIAVSIIGFALAPIFPGLVSGTSARVGEQHAANTIGMQIAAAGFGGAVIPSLAGVLAQNISLEAIPVYLVGVFSLLIVLYLGTLRPRQVAV
jgi:fucose permease